jgi:cytochrome c biogenesis protein CcmG, thiol:disulfide interchange protein DsbE
MDWKRAFVVTGAIGAPFIALLAFGMTRDPRQIPSPLPGKAAPTWAQPVFAPGADEVLTRTVGDTVRLADLKGQVVVLNFWASWCLACRDEHADLSQAATQLRDKGVQVFGMLYNDKEENGVRWIADMGGQAYPSLSDPGARTAIDYGLYGVPETFVIDQTGRVAHKFIGPVSAPALMAKVDSILAAGAASGGAAAKAPDLDSAAKTTVPATKSVP